FARVFTSERVPPESELTAWLVTATTNYCLNRIRDRSRRRKLLDERVAPAVETESGEKAQLIAEVRRLIARADPRQAEAALYVYVEGLSQDEAAELLGVSQRTVSNLLARFVAWAREESASAKAAGGRS